MPRPFMNRGCQRAGDSWLCAGKWKALYGADRSTQENIASSKIESELLEM